MRIPTEYISFDDINRRLNVLKLQQEIEQESLKLHFYRAKADLVPHYLISEMSTAIIQSSTLKNMLLVFLTKKVIGFFQRKRE